MTQCYRTVLLPQVPLYWLRVMKSGLCSHSQTITNFRLCRCPLLGVVWKGSHVLIRLVPLRVVSLGYSFLWWTLAGSSLLMLTVPMVWGRKKKHLFSTFTNDSVFEFSFLNYGRPPQSESVFPSPWGDAWNPEHGNLCFSTLPRTLFTILRQSLTKLAGFEFTL